MRLMLTEALKRAFDVIQRPFKAISAQHEFEVWYLTPLTASKIKTPTLAKDFFTGEGF